MFLSELGLGLLYASGLSPFRLKCGNYILNDFSSLRKPFSCFFTHEF